MQDKTAVKSATSPNGSHLIQSGWWAPTPKERCDFYHRPRAFPEAVARWRKKLANQVTENSDLFRRVAPGAGVSPMKSSLGPTF